MNQLSNILDRGNLTPRERFLLLIQNDIHRMKAGKDILSEADKAALENWHAKTNEEAKEWNRLNEGWKYSGRIDIEAQFHFTDAQSSHLQVKPIVMELLKQSSYREMRYMISGIKSVKKVSAKEAVEIIAKQRAAKLREGMDFEYAVYQFAFGLLSKKDQAALVELYPDIQTDHQYLDEEEIIANLLDGKEYLSRSAKKKLAELIAEKSYNKFAKEYQLFHYFACIPLIEVARHFLKKNGIQIGGKPLSQNQESDDEDDSTHAQVQAALKAYAAEHDTTITEMLKEGFISWYDEVGFVYTPLVVSDSKKLFGHWLTIKSQARVQLQQLIDAGTLQIRKRSPDESQHSKLYSKDLIDAELQGARKTLELCAHEIPGGELDEKIAFELFSDTVITGESLYDFMGDLEFVRKFKERTDEYDPNLGLVYADDDPEHAGEHLDDELLVCDLTSKGESSIFSPFGIAIQRLEAHFESITLFEEVEKNSKTVLQFKSKQVEKMFRESRDSFISSYEKLLALKGLMTKLSSIYECDMTFSINERLNQLDGYIFSHNEALTLSEKPIEYGRNTNEDSERKSVAVIDPSLFIDKDHILPDERSIMEHVKRLKDIFWDF